MEEEDYCCSSCCCCGRGAGSHRQNTMIQVLRQKETQRRRMAQFFAVVVLLLMSVVLAVLIMITVVYGGGDHQSPDSQTMLQPESHSSGISAKQQQQRDFKNPSAMLTAPAGNITVLNSDVDNDVNYLAWESDDGNAFCHGGFSYSSGNLVVPENGIYRVFLQITYESRDDFECPSDELRLSNTVFYARDSYKKNVPLLSSVETVSCIMEQDGTGTGWQWSKSLYTAGLFSLEANSRLRVTSMYPELIIKKEYQVFFGAELLPQ